MPECTETKDEMQAERFLARGQLESQSLRSSGDGDGSYRQKMKVACSRSCCDHGKFIPEVKMNNNFFFNLECLLRSNLSKRSKKNSERFFLFKTG